MFRRFQESWRLTKSCWAVLQTDKQLLLFPILSGLLSTLLLVGFVAPSVYVVSQDPKILESPALNVVAPLLFFLLYFCLNSGILFCNTAVLICVKQRFDGGQPTVMGGIKGALEFLPQIFSWAFLGGCLGVILRQLEENFGFLGSLVARLCGGAWAIVSYFALPVMVFEKVGPTQALRRSKEIISQTWGQSLGAYLGLSALTSIFGWTAILALLGSIGLCVATESGTPLAVTVVTILLAGVAVSIVSSCLTQIFQAALYVYATKKEVPGCFDSFAMEGAFQQRNGKKWVVLRR
ncbi:hypothetical protein JST97_15925 [bacterium]|nr:hypothetical protein [bacterium]